MGWNVFIVLNSCGTKFVTKCSTFLFLYVHHFIRSPARYIFFLYFLSPTRFDCIHICCLKCLWLWNNSERFYWANQLILSIYHFRIIPFTNRSRATKSSSWLNLQMPLISFDIIFYEWNFETNFEIYFYLKYQLKASDREGET